MRCTVSLAAVLLATLVAPPVPATEFRIETEVVLDGQDDPISENLTLFSNGAVYDFLLTAPKQTTIFDLRRQQFVVLDHERRVKLVLPRTELLRLVAALQNPQLQKKDPFFFKPEFDVQFDPDTGMLTLSAEPMQYKVKTIKPPQPAVVQTYREFADWYARLNGTMPGRMPPFARLQLNSALAERGLIPESVQITIRPHRRLMEKAIRAESRHLFIWQLSNTDHKRIERARHDLAVFEPVSFDQFHEQPATAAHRGR